jgi:DNA-directed RNA polymerase subunit RPC12/RpoP
VTAWARYGACPTCGALIGQACTRYDRRLRTPHAGRHRVGYLPGARYRCATCGETFEQLAPAERHADGHGGARIELARVQ